ncbi:hypothetical protein FE257_003476 [Aspergillus nanangensis]|uniref:Uncharacterized protein n=1 Tax=Aspergillus nanangensis TaxID=2582783 RepID=A0AAD4CBY2_ASPNN|nr:hypothetical protein FE257_003476 [Aspergillus nanangensis]
MLRADPHMDYHRYNWLATASPGLMQVRVEKPPAWKSMDKDIFKKKTSSENGSSIASISSSENDEPKKAIITESITAALRRCVIHLIPTIASITIITLNLKGTYLGADLIYPIKSETINLLLLQIAAKAHEITIVASLGVVVLQFVRHELLYGDGLPLGLLGSGITFNHFEFFFQREFYGGLGYVAGHGNKPRKIMFIGLVVVSGWIAALAGPSSAVLLVPKSQEWKAGGTRFYLNGTEDQFWPSDLSDVSELQQLCGGDNSTRLGVCPGGGFYSLWNHWGTMKSTNFRSQDVRSYAKDISGSRFYWPISSASSLIPPLYALGDSTRGPNGKTSLTQPHAATVVVLQKLAEDWWEALTVQNHLSSNQVNDRVVSAKFKNAMSITRCAKPQRLGSSDKAVQFPSIDGRYNFFTKDLPLTVDSLNSTPTDHLRFQWVHLPLQFGAPSIGGLFEAPWDGTKPSEASRAVMGCTVQAGWVPATVFTDKYTFWTGWYPWNILFGDRIPTWSPKSESSTNGRIAFGEEWLDLLTPKAPIKASGTGVWQPSTIESIFLNAGVTPHPESAHERSGRISEDWLGNDNSTWDRISLVEAIVCSVVLDGLSRTGSYRVFKNPESGNLLSVAGYNPLPDFKSRILKNEVAIEAPTISPNEFTTIEAEMGISGFSLQRSLASYLAMPILLIHILLAMAHMIYVIHRRRTSRCWSSVGELIALSQNSRPAPDILQNAGAGIKRSKTYAQVAKVRVRRDPGSHNQEHVELLFDSSLDAQKYQDHEMGHMRYRSLRHIATWPKNQARVSLSRNEDPRGLNASTERLVPQISPEEKEVTALVRVNHSYG